MGLFLQPRRMWSIAGLSLAMWFSTAGLGLLAQEQPVPDTTLVVDPEHQPGTAPDAPTKPDEKERRVKLTAGLAALAGIAIVGIVFAAVILIWGARLRRIVREPLEATGKQDPFWFLRPSKSDQVLLKKDEED
jgi:hypothetical protein